MIIFVKDDLELNAIEVSKTSGFYQLGEERMKANYNSRD